MNEFDLYDSKEEVYFLWYLKELINKGLVKDYIYQPKTFPLSEKAVSARAVQLKTKIKKTESALLPAHGYSADFFINWNISARYKLFACHSEENSRLIGDYPFIANKRGESSYYSVIEVKPSFDQNNMTRLFAINQKWVYSKYGIYVQKIIPHPRKVEKSFLPASSLFLRSFVPKRFLLTDGGGQQRKIKYKYKLIDQYLSQIQEK